MSNKRTTSISESAEPQRIPLHEGAEGAFPIELGYVQQGNRICVTLGDASDVDLLEGQTLVESIDDLDTVITEGRDNRGNPTKNVEVKDGRWFVEGIFQRSDTENANKRVYPKKLWERLLAEDGPVQQKIREGGMIGHVEHPDDGRSKLLESSLIVRENTLRADGTVWGRAELLDTPGGVILQELTRKGAKWGVSSRGNGTVNAKGVVEDSFNLETYDAVARPSTPGAWPKPVMKEDEDGLDEGRATWPSQDGLSSIVMAPDSKTKTSGSASAWSVLANGPKAKDFYQRLTKQKAVQTGTAYPLKFTTGSRGVQVISMKGGEDLKSKISTVLSQMKMTQEDENLEEASLWGSAKHLARMFDSNSKALKKSLAKGDQSGTLAMLAQLRDDAVKALAGVKARLRESEELDEDQLDELNSAEMIQWAGDFCKRWKGGRQALLADAKVTPAKAQTIDTLVETLERLGEDDMIDESHYEDLIESEAQSRIVMRLVGMLQERNQTVLVLQEQVESMSESETSPVGTEIEEELADAEAKLEESQNRVDTLSTKLFEVKRQLRQATLENESLTSRIQQAQQYVADTQLHTEESLTDPVLEAYETAVDKHPRLMGHRDELLECVSVAEFDALAAKLNRPKVGMLLPTTTVSSEPVRHNSGRITESTNLPACVVSAAKAVASMRTA